MSWLFRHKFVMLLFVAAGAYFFVNPPGRFGIVRNGFVVYNRIPVLLFDCYIDPANKIHLEGDLGIGSNITYWFENHFTSFRNKGPGLLPLLVGTGFGESVEVMLSQKMLQRCRDSGFEPRLLPSREATDLYNSLRDRDKTAAILLKVK